MVINVYSEEVVVPSKKGVHVRNLGNPALSQFVQAEHE